MKAYRVVTCQTELENRRTSVHGFSEAQSKFLESLVELRETLDSLELCDKMIKTKNFEKVLHLIYRRSWESINYADRAIIDQIQDLVRQCFKILA